MKNNPDGVNYEMVWRTSLMKEMTDEDLERTSQLLKDLMGGRHVAILVNGYTAWKFTVGDENHSGILLPYLRKALGRKFNLMFLEHEDKDVVEGREIRTIKTEPEEVVVPHASDILTIVYSNESGFTYNGTVYWVLKNFDHFERHGARRAWFLTGLDYQRIAQIPVYRGPGKYKGTVWSLLKHTEDAFRELVEADRFKYMANVSPENKWIQEEPKITSGHVKDLEDGLYEGDLLREANMLYKVSRGKLGVSASSMKRLQKVICDHYEK